MCKILVSGLVNIETTARVRRFPVEYYPIDYPFFGVRTAAAGVAYNIAKALRTLGDDVVLTAMVGGDFPAQYLLSELEGAGISTEHVRRTLRETPNSVVLYDETGRRQIYCDLKDIQQTGYGFAGDICGGVDLVVACNINFNRPLLALAKKAGKCIATDVHVLTQIDDAYNQEFMEYADILFLSDEGIGADYGDFLAALADRYGCGILVLGRGGRGAAMYVRQERRMYEVPAAWVGETVNTVGAGDALFSGFLHQYARGCGPLEALVRAEVFAAAKIRCSGAAEGFVGEAELAALYGHHGEQIRAAARCWEV